MASRNARSKSSPAGAAGQNVTLAAVGALLERADVEAQRTSMSVVNSGHVLLAAARIDGSVLGGLLRDAGADAAKLATHVERLARLDEGRADDPALTAKVAAALTEGARQAADPTTLAQIADVALAQLLGQADTVATRALDNAGHDPVGLVGRLRRALGLDEPRSAGNGDRDGDADTRATAGAAYRMTPQQYAELALDGDYKTAAQKKPFHAEVRGGDLHIFSGWRFQKKAYDGDGNSVYFDAQRLVRESIEFVHRQGEVELGSCAESRVPEPGTFEAFLRQFSISGNLASYIPAILEHLGAIQIEKRKGGVHWAVPGDRR